MLSGAAADASAFRLYADGKVQGDPDMVFYGQPQNDDNTISWQQNGNSLPAVTGDHKRNFLHILTQTADIRRKDGIVAVLLP
ncbi:TerD family protein, partial [Morganella morganii]